MSSLKPHHLADKCKQIFKDTSFFFFLLNFVAQEEIFWLQRSQKVKFIIGGKLQRDNIRNLKFDRKSGLNDLTRIIKLAI